jgi:hypothetical protein
LAAAWIRRDFKRERRAAASAKDAAELRNGPLYRRLRPLFDKYLKEYGKRKDGKIAERIVRQDLPRELAHLKRLGLIDDDFRVPNANTLRRSLKPK